MGKIYVIKMFSNIEKINNGSGETVGYFFNYEDACKRVKNNILDIHECCYDYALILELEEGIYNFCERKNERWFKWNPEKEEYELTSSPVNEDNHFVFSL